MKYLFLLFLSVGLFGNSGLAEEADESLKSKPFAKVELTSNLLEDGYTQTGNSFGLLTDVGYKWEQFEIGVRGNNVYFEGERAHLTLQPHLSIISNFSSTSRFFIEHEERLYFIDSARNGARSSVGFQIHEYLIKYESLINWWGLDITKSRWSLSYRYDWSDEYSSDFKMGYNTVGEVNTQPFGDVATNIKFKKDNFEYYAEFIFLSSIVNYIPIGQPINFRLGVKTEF